MKAEFIDGLIVKKANEKAPAWVKAKISIKRDNFIKWLQGQEGEWINADIKESKEGKLYCQIDTWKPNQKEAEEEVNISDVPF